MSDLADAADCAANVLSLLETEVRALGCGAARVLPALREAVDNARMPQSSKEKQEAFRARNAMLGLTEVRGIYLPPDRHAELKAEAQKLLKKAPAKPPVVG